MRRSKLVVWLSGLALLAMLVPSQAYGNEQRRSEPKVEVGIGYQVEFKDLTTGEKEALVARHRADKRAGGGSGDISAQANSSQYWPFYYDYYTCSSNTGTRVRDNRVAADD